MKKKFLIIAMCAMLAASAAACKNSGSKYGNDLPTPDVNNVTPDPTGEPAGSTEVNKIEMTDYEEYAAKSTVAENYMGITYKKVTDDDVNETILALREDNMNLVELEDRAVENGLVAQIDYVGTMDGVAFEGGTGSYDLEIGSHSFIDGFEEGLIGAVKGEKRTLNLKFPEDYQNNDSLAGQDVVFEVTVNGVCEYCVPDLDDAFVTDVSEGEFTNVADFTTYVHDTMVENAQFAAVTEYIVANTKYGELNQKYINDSFDAVKSYYESYATMYGLDLSTFLTYMGVVDENAFWDELKGEIVEEEKQRIALYAIAKKENVTITDSEYTEECAKLAEQTGTTVEEFVEQYTESYIRQDIIINKMLDILIANTVASEE